jgi:hypothetical protein
MRQNKDLRSLTFDLLKSHFALMCGLMVLPGHFQGVISRFLCLPYDLRFLPASYERACGHQ